MFNKTFSGVNKIIFGLGNPGKEYHLTRHNFGKLIIEKIAQENKLKFKKYKKFSAAQININNKKILLVKSLTYMNLSGEVLQQFKIQNLKFKIIEKLLVIVDDINLPFGKIRFRKSGSAGGHNGLKSLIHHLGSDNFSRLRLGIATSALQHTNTANFVLEKFSLKEQKLLPQIINAVVKGLKIYLKDENLGTSFWNTFSLD